MDANVYELAVNSARIVEPPQKTTSLSAAAKFFRRRIRIDFLDFTFANTQSMSSRH